MARISGIDLPRDKRIEVALTYIFGIGPHRAAEVLANTGINPDTRVKDLSEEDEAKLREIIGHDFIVEGDLRRNVAMDIKRLIEIGSYRGLSMQIEYDTFENKFRLLMHGAFTHRVDIGNSADGNIIRIENALAQMQKKVENAHDHLVSMEQQMAVAKEEIGKLCRKETAVIGVCDKGFSDGFAKIIVNNN